MLALFGNIAPLEILVILGLAVVLFGDRLPEVAAKAYAQFRRMREAMDRFRRDTGIDRELREIERNVRDAAWRENLKSSLAPPAPGAPQVIERTDIGLGKETRGPEEELPCPEAEGAQREEASDRPEEPAGE